MTTEEVCYDNYRIELTRPSALGLSQEITTDEGFTCPRCKCPNPEIEHGDSGQCPNCNLHFRRYGNGLDCSDEFIPAHTPGRDVQALREWNERPQGLLAKVKAFFEQDALPF